MVRYIGSALGPMIGSLLYVESDLKPLFLTCGVIYVVTVLVGGWWMRMKGLKVVTT
ncbi:hypothetical protein [Paenibacillus agri]|uniref:MFS transporter n=1 Tax=Paenibacillus agri TaxID=2744309 RepID=A0A850EXJ5_9BACL|nr:hypothetical protein [Paenibacillus agri]NUU63622.1 hypothetical protein [Paenibacillus agri]